MATLGQAKILGGIGSILALLVIVPLPYGGGLLAIVGWILVVIAVKEVSDALGDPRIFNDMLIAAVLSIIGIVVAVVVVIAAFFQFFGLGRVTFTSGNPPPAGFFALLASIIIGLVVAWIFFIVAAFFIKKSYGSISLRTNLGIFNTTGLLFLIGAVTTIIIVGVIIIFVALILQTVAFFSLPEQFAQPGVRPYPYAPPPPPPPTAQPAIQPE